MTKLLLEVQNLEIEIPTAQGIIRPVDKVNFSLSAGETLAIVGESGSGKTLSALSILKLLPQNARCSGQSNICFEGQNLLEVSESQMQHIRGRHIAMIFQEPMTALNPVLTIRYQLKEVLKKHRHLSGKALQKRALELLCQVGIAEPQRCLLAYPHQLSGGQRQRVCIAMALAGEPDLLIADEPTTALDVTIQAQILKLLKELQRKYNMGLLLISHDLGVVAQVADHVCVMQKGKMVESAGAAQFFAHPQNPYSQSLFAALPQNLPRDVHKKLDITTPILTVRDLDVYLSQRQKKGWTRKKAIPTLSDINLTLHANETLAIVGESGSGKTTLAKAILRLFGHTKGDVILNQATPSNLAQMSQRELARWLQIVWQDPYSSLDPRQSIEAILAEALNVRGKIANQDEVIATLLTQVGLSPNTVRRYPHQFSGGQRQRIAIARALAANPKILICDEPTSALDVSVQAQILHLLQDLQAKLGLAYLLITHNMAVVEYLADNVAVMYHGKIVEYGTVDQVLNHPKDDYTKLLLSSVLKL